VWIRQLRLRNLRNISSLDLDLAPGVSVFSGPNGAGKTTILEGAYLLSHGQSFRAAHNEILAQRGQAAFSVRGEVSRVSGPIRLGLDWRDGKWTGRVNETAAGGLGEVLREFALVAFDPGSHSLICGDSRERRRFLDWGVFHVEPDYLARTRQFRRALRQRNALLKQAGNDSDLELWDAELVRAAEPLAVQREAYFDGFAREVKAASAALLPELGEAAIALHRGWPQDESLAGALLQARARDRIRGHTSRGPHRADWTLRFADAPSREQLSRGQEKLCALACVLAQARLHASMTADWPVVVLDDLPSELDEPHQRSVLDLLAATPAQVLISGIEAPRCLGGTAFRVFHVEHGRVLALL
jgi:DNA replication and repair protein RecF